MNQQWCATVIQNIHDLFQWIIDHNGAVDTTALVRRADLIYIEAFSASGIRGVMGYVTHLHGMSARAKAIDSIRCAMLMVRMPLTWEHQDILDSLIPETAKAYHDEHY